MKVKADMMKTKEEKGQKAAINHVSNAPERPAGSLFVFMVEFSKSFKLNFPDATSVSEKALSLAKASYIYRLWLICIILVVWSFICIYLLDILAYVLIVSTGLYDGLAAIFVVTLHFSETHLRIILIMILGTVIKISVGVPIRIVLHTVLGDDESQCWMVIWNVICALYSALCRQIIDFERDPALCVLINVLKIFFGVLAGRRYQSTWTVLTLIEGGIFWLISRVRVAHIRIFLVNMLLLCLRLGGFLG